MKNKKKLLRLLVMAIVLSVFFFVIEQDFPWWPF